MRRRPRRATRADLDQVAAWLDARAQAHIKDLRDTVARLSDDVSALAETSRAVLLARTVPKDDRLSAAREAAPKLQDPKET